MIMGNNKEDDSYSENAISSSTAAIAPIVVNARTLVAQT